MFEDHNVLLHDLTPALARQVIREIAKDTTRILITEHAQKQMAKRQITTTQLYKCLSLGKVIEGPSRGTKGNWEFSVEALTAGDVVVVAAALDHDQDGNKIIIITAYRR